MKKLLAAISILFIVVLVESSSASPIFRVDPPSRYSAVVEDETSGGVPFLDNLLDGSAGSVFKHSQWSWLFH